MYNTIYNLCSAGNWAQAFLRARQTLLPTPLYLYLEALWFPKRFWLWKCHVHKTRLLNINVFSNDHILPIFLIFFHHFLVVVCLLVCLVRFYCCFFFLEYFKINPSSCIISYVRVMFILKSKENSNTGDLRLVQVLPLPPVTFVILSKLQSFWK